MILYDSQEINKTFVDYNVKYREISRIGLPKQLTLQQIVFNGPHGRVFGVAFTWSSEEIEEGRRWREKIASLGTVIMNTVDETTIPKWYTGNAALVPPALYGYSRTHNVKEMTQEVVECIGRGLGKMPADPGTMCSIHQLRNSSENATGHSVFAAREPHFMVEIMGCAITAENVEIAEQWAANIWKDVHNTDSNNILHRTYISLDCVEGSLELDTLTKYYGVHTRDILTAKKHYDPENVFGLTVPRLDKLL